jgi:hypothetical protein
MRKPPVEISTEGHLRPNLHEGTSMDKRTAPDQQRAPYLPGISGMAVDLFDTASLAVAIVAAFAIKYVAAAVTK